MQSVFHFLYELVTELTNVKQNFNLHNLTFCQWWMADLHCHDELALLQNYTILSAILIINRKSFTTLSINISKKILICLIKATFEIVRVCYSSTRELSSTLVHRAWNPEKWTVFADSQSCSNKVKWNESFPFAFAVAFLLFLAAEWKKKKWYRHGRCISLVKLLPWKF